MYGIALQGLLRMNRAMIITTLCPEHKVVAIAGSEIISLIGPYINPRTSTDVLGLAFAILYTPDYTKYFFDFYTKKNIVYLQTEILTTFLFILLINISEINKILLF
jgi:hypothetical protein